MYRILEELSKRILDFPGISWLLTWPVIVPNILSYGIKPIIFTVFFCQYCRAPLSPAFPVLYLPLFFLSHLVFLFGSLKGFPSLLWELVLLALCGHHFCCPFISSSSGLAPASLSSGKQPGFSSRRMAWLQCLTLSALIYAVNSVCHGISQLFAFWVVSDAPPSWDLLFASSDTARELFQELLLIFSLFLIRKYFDSLLKERNHPVFAVLAVPLFYLSLVERTIQDFVYGDTIVFDTDQGIVFPVIHHTEIFVLQLFAYACLFLTLGACQAIQKALRRQQMLQILQQQRQAQESYIQEARLRYDQTRSFRHDIRNHLAVLAELLSQEKIQEAGRYLESLNHISSSLSAPANTGNAAVDALLGNKLAMAAQAGISVSCTLKLPAGSPVSDIDWCILLSNGIDNGIRAAGRLPSDHRSLVLSGSQKGNFFLLTIENSCQDNLSRIPSPGIGLSNIQAVMEKYQGKMELHVEKGTFRLQLLFF